MNDYKSAFNAAAADISAIIALLGFTKYPGVDPVLRAIADLILEKAESQVLREERDAANKRADTLEHRMMGMMTRHFAEAWHNRDTQKALDGYLSAGIAQLEQERDAALANVDALAVQVLKLGGTISFAHHRTDQAGQVPQAWLDVQAERRRQVEAEGWTPEHDDAHSHGEMARAAACYALAGSSAPNDGTAALLVSLAWPWDEQWWKPTSARRDLVKACALALAEIERLDRAGISQNPQPGATTASSWRPVPAGARILTLNLGPGRSPGRRGIAHGNPV
ncbi:hypothetical protein P4198_25095 [Pseudomonas aeruginosa]|nr:hypothetical protein [Pseudomonas aeruginosa]